MLAKKAVLYPIPGDDVVEVRGDSVMDVYLPRARAGDVPALLFVSGYVDEGLEAVFGCRFRQMGQVASWARVTAGAGLAAITYSNREPEEDLHALVDKLRAHGSEYGVDARAP